MMNVTSVSALRATSAGCWTLASNDRARAARGGDVLVAMTDHPMAIDMVPSLETYLAEEPGRGREADERGWTMLHREALAGNACVVSILLQHGADARGVTEEGETPASLARSRGWTRIVGLLAAHGG